ATWGLRSRLAEERVRAERAERVVEIGGLLEPIAVEQRPWLYRRAARRADREDERRRVPRRERPDPVTAAQLSARVHRRVEPGEGRVAVLIAERVPRDDRDAVRRGPPVAGGQAIAGGRSGDRSGGGLGGRLEGARRCRDARGRNGDLPAGQHLERD